MKKTLYDYSEAGEFVTAIDGSEPEPYKQLTLSRTADGRYCFRKWTISDRAGGMISRKGFYLTPGQLAALRNFLDSMEIEPK